MLTIGDINIHLINDCSIMADPGGVFGLVPRVLWSRYYEPSADHLVPSVHTCLLVQTGGKNIIVDTGFGEKLDEKVQAMWQMTGAGGLRRGLAQLGLQPGDIDLVIDTHLHGDHAGGNTIYDGDVLVATFPNAEYVVQRREYEDAMQPNERTRATYMPMNYQPLVASGQMRLLDGDTEIMPGVFGVVTPGHTPAHMAVRFESQEQHGIFVCDMATLAIHFERLGWMTAYDVEPLITLETKRQWQQWAIDNDALILFSHEPFRKVGRFVEDERVRRTIEGIDEPHVNA